MAHITRESGWPIQDGETAEAATVENELAKIFSEINGSLDNTNLATDADIAGTKLADAGVTKVKLNADAVTQIAVVTGTATANMSDSATSTAWRDISDLDSAITDATVTAQSTDDYFEMSFYGDFNTRTGIGYDFGFDIDGTQVACQRLVSGGQDAESERIAIAYVVQPSDTASTVIKPIFKATATDNGSDQLSGIMYGRAIRQFTVKVVPVK